MRVVPKPAGRPSVVNYNDYDQPTISRHSQKRAVGDGLQVETMKEDLLDIPAFLRRQAD